MKTKPDFSAALKVLAEMKKLRVKPAKAYKPTFADRMGQRSKK